MVTFWVEEKANRTPPMEDELKVYNLFLKVALIHTPQDYTSFLLTKTQTGQLLNQNQYNLIQKALVDAMAAKKKADAGGADGAKAEG